MLVLPEFHVQIGGHTSSFVLLKSPNACCRAPGETYGLPCVRERGPAEFSGCP
jgi:hypothetical protein